MRGVFNRAELPIKPNNCSFQLLLHPFVVQGIDIALPSYNYKNSCQLLIRALEVSKIPFGVVKLCCQDFAFSLNANLQSDENLINILLLNFVGKVRKS